MRERKENETLVDSLVIGDYGSFAAMFPAVHVAVLFMLWKVVHGWSICPPVHLSPLDDEMRREKVS